MYTSESRERLACAPQARVVHENVDTAFALDDGLDDLAHIVVVGDVQRERVDVRVGEALHGV